MLAETRIGSTPADASYALAAQISQWWPEPATVLEKLDPKPVLALAATLGIAPPVGAELPPLWHWLYFLDWPPTNELGVDGHPQSGHFLPPLRHRTRMFAGGRLELLAPLETSVTTQRRTTLARAEVKQGRSGELLFIVLRHEYSQYGELRVVEEQDIAYRSGPTPAASGATPDNAGSPTQRLPGQTIRPSSTMLFRFSALTGNAHRIHYDADYARDVEGYRERVIHGPLQILLMLGAAGRDVSPAAWTQAQYRLSKPAFLGDLLNVRTTVSQNSINVSLTVDGSNKPSANAQLTFR